MDDLISRQAAIDTMQIFIDGLDKESPAYKSLSIAFDRCIIELKRLPSAQSRMTCDGCKYANRPTGWSDVCVLCRRNFRNFTDRYER